MQTKRQGHNNDPAFPYNLITQANIDYGGAFLGYQKRSPNPRWPDTYTVASDIGTGTAE